MMKLRLVISGLVAAALFVPGQASAYSRPLSEEVAEAIAPAAEGEAATPPADAPAAAPAPAATATAAPNATPAPAATSEKKATPSPTAEELEEQSGWGAGADIDHTMTTSTFLSGKDAAGNNREEYAFVGGSLGVNGRYTGKLKNIKYSVSARWGFSVEYTRPDNDTGRRFQHSDLRLGLSLPGNIKIPVIDVAVNPSIGIQVPLTAESWGAGLILGSSAGVSLSRGWKYLSVSLSGSVSHGFYTNVANIGYQQSAYNAKDLDGRNTFLCRTGESICGINGMNPALGLSGSLAVNIRPLDQLSIGLSYGLGHTWKYAASDDPDDPYRCKTLDSTGQYACHPGTGQGDRMSANISVSYSFTEHVAATLYLQNSQQPQMIDGTTGKWAFRFPFFDFATPTSGATALGLSISGNL